MSGGTVEVKVGEAKATVPALDDIRGHEMLRRAMEVALVGGHPMAVLYGPGSMTPLLVEYVGARVKAYGIPFHALAMPPCKCGNYGSPREECRCRVSSIEAHLARLARRRDDFDIFLDVGSPGSGKVGPAEPFGRVLERVEAARKRPEPKPRADDDFRRMFARELGADAAALAKVDAVAASVARLDGKAEVEQVHLCEAMQYSFCSCQVLRHMGPREGLEVGAPGGKV